MKKPAKKKKKKSPRKKNHPEVKAQEVSAIEKDTGENKKIPEKQVSRPVQRPVQKKEPEKKHDGKGGLFKFIGVAGRFLRESRGELKKVKWPTRKELLASTAMVIVLVLLVSFFLGIIDFALIKIIKNVVG